jgi:hypothetical protein
MDAAELTRNTMMYFVLPLWLVAGFADYLCHRAADIEHTTGWEESILHLLQFGEMAIPVLAALFLEINALVIIVMIICFLLHEATAIWDVSYAAARRQIPPIEQHVHSFLEMLPLTGLLMVVILHWDQFIALFGRGTPRFDITLKQPPLPWLYTASILSAVLIFEVLPYGEEFIRGLRAKRVAKHSRGEEANDGGV